MAKASTSRPIKYADKSTGQPGLVSIFADLKNLLSDYVKGKYIAKEDLPGNYSVYYNDLVEISGRKYPDLPFAGLLIQKGYVGFYFFCIYPDPDLKKDLPQGLLKVLKGKTCFHIKKSSPEILADISAALQTGYKYYLRRGWK
jgi:hypothetical protein